MKIINQLTNKIFLYKLFFKKWFIFKQYDEKSKSLYKQCLLSVDEIYCLFDYILRLRNKKKYNKADIIKNKLTDCGYYWYMPSKINNGNLSGVVEKKLRINFGDKNIISGYIMNSLPGNHSSINLTL